MMSVKSRFRRFMLSLIKWNEWNLLNDFPEKFPFPKVAFRGRRKNKTQCWVHRNTVNARWSSHKNPKGSNKLSHNIHWKPAERYFACPLLIIIWVKCFIHVLCWWLFNKKKHTHTKDEHKLFPRNPWNVPGWNLSGSKKEKTLNSW